MRAVRQLTVLLALAAIWTVVAASPAAAITAEQHQQNSPGLDTSDANVGGWNNTTPGTAARPFIKYLAVNNGGSDIVVINNNGGSPVQTPTPQVATDIYAFVAPVNACSNTPGGQCYAVPNRVSIWLGHSNAGNWSNDLTSAIPAVNENTTIDLIVGFNSAYSTLRWSWANGVPSYWSSTVTASGGDVHIKFKAKTMPNSAGMPNSCTTIPVSSCGDSSTRPTSEVFAPQLLLSMDTTLDAAFTGVLFGSASAFIGSLESSPITAGQAPTLTYGVAAPHLNWNGSDRSGRFYALVPNSILTLFGTSAASFNSDLLPIARTGDAGSYTPSWSEWTAGTNGTAGQLLTISNISFSSPKFVVGRQSSNNGGSGGGGGGGSSSTGSGSGGGGSTSLKVGQKATFAQLLAIANLRAPAGAKTTATVSTPKICKVVGKAIKGLAAGTCRGSMTIKPKKGKAQKKAFTFAVTGAKRLPLALHH
ncbi:MAG: hypothetical protein WCN97_07325 [Thermoleophilia bacterium]